MVDRLIDHRLGQNGPAPDFHYRII